MGLKSSDMPGPQHRDKPEPKVEQATAAPGETRDVTPPGPVELCGKNHNGHPCDREAGHKGKHSYRGE